MRGRKSLCYLENFTKDDVSIDDYDEKLYFRKWEKIYEAEEECQNKILYLVWLELDQNDAADKARINYLRSLGEDLMNRVKKKAREVMIERAELMPVLPMSAEEKKLLIFRNKNLRSDKQKLKR